MIVPVLRENMRLFEQSRQRCDMVGCLMLDWTLKEPHLGQKGPFGHRHCVNHCSAVSTSGNNIDQIDQGHTLAVAFSRCFMTHISPLNVTLL